MKLTTLDEDLRIHQKLEDEPNDVGGLSAQALKEKFDQAGVTIQTYLNETHLPEEEQAVADALREAKAYTDKKTAALGQGNMKQAVYDTKKRNLDIFDYTDEKIQELKARKSGGTWFCVGQCEDNIASVNQITPITEFQDMTDPDGLWSEKEKAFVVPEGGRIALMLMSARSYKYKKSEAYLRIKVNGREQCYRIVGDMYDGVWHSEFVLAPVLVETGDRITLVEEAVTGKDAEGIVQVRVKQVAVLILM